jgi:UDP-2,3-diacylglucosamine hydrolase
MHLVTINIFASISILVRQQQHSLPREKRFVAWLDEVKDEAIFLVGDLFDFGSNINRCLKFVRVLGKLAEIRDSGIPIYFS